jgi:hypothetical protein
MLKQNNFMTYPNPTKHSAVFWFFSDSYVLIVRSMKHIFKNLDQLLSLAIQPIMFMLLFRYVFGGAIDTGGTTYVNYLVAGTSLTTASVVPYIKDIIHGKTKPRIVSWAIWTVLLGIAAIVSFQERQMASAL